MLWGLESIFQDETEILQSMLRFPQRTLQQSDNARQEIPKPVTCDTLSSLIVTL